MANCPACNNLNPDEAGFCNRCGGQLTADNSLKPGDEIGGGRYRIDSLLGEGGMGTVYKATDLSLGRTAALKLLHPELTAHSTARRRMEQEARILASIEHPNVVQVRNVFEEGDVLAMELEFMPGGDLLSAIPNGGMPETEAVRIMGAVLSGLGAIHDAGLVHRDIKPDNVLLSGNSTPKVTDLGIAHDPGAREKTRVGATLGTPEYMAPEQIQGLRVDLRTDVYATGIVLYRMLTGDFPFRATTDFEWQVAHVQHEPDMERLRGKVSAAVIAVVEKALAKKPERRWRSAEEMAAALNESADEAQRAAANAAIATTPGPAAAINVEVDATTESLPASPGGTQVEHPLSRGEKKGLRAGIAIALLGLLASSLATFLPDGGGVIGALIGFICAAIATVFVRHWRGPRRYQPWGAAPRAKKVIVASLVVLIATGVAIALYPAEYPSTYRSYCYDECVAVRSAGIALVALAAVPIAALLYHFWDWRKWLGVGSKKSPATAAD